MSMASYEEPTFFLWDSGSKEKDRDNRITLKNLQTGKTYSFELQESFVVGRSKENCDLQIAPEDRYMSGKHLRFIKGRDGVYVEDLQTKNGTRVNGKRILSRTRIRRGDVIRMGRSEFEITL